MCPHIRPTKDTRQRGPSPFQSLQQSGWRLLPGGGAARAALLSTRLGCTRWLPPKGTGINRTAEKTSRPRPGTAANTNGDKPPGQRRPWTRGPLVTLARGPRPQPTISPPKAQLVTDPANATPSLSCRPRTLAPGPICVSSFPGTVHPHRSPPTSCSSTALCPALLCLLPGAPCTFSTSPLQEAKPPQEEGSEGQGHRGKGHLGSKPLEG